MPRPDMETLAALHDGWLDGGHHHYPVKVQYEDTDMGGIVYHAQYLAFAERGRSAMLRLAGIDQNAMAASGSIFAVRRLKIKYAAPARLGESLMVQTGLVAMRASVMVLEQIILAAEKGDAMLARLLVDIAHLHDGRAAAMSANICAPIIATIQE